ncbi:EamA family transporter RarD [Schaalia sp. ZJ405]|uniref:EamA family transporter RarD n=1 Tax=Schaalia sp. ZJ405 TaxID=2709403 RepID=UPI003FA75155
MSDVNIPGSSSSPETPQNTQVSTGTTRATTGTPHTENNPRALALGIATYVIWGFFPLYFALLEPAGAVEVIVHRALWGLVFCLFALVVTRRLRVLRALLTDHHVLWRLSLAGGLIVVNWSTYVYAVLTGHTVDAAIGYFINPLITVALSLIVLRERISRLQKVALGFGAVAVVILIVGQGRLPWLSLTLALSFGFYSLVKKDVAPRVDPLAGMAVETAAVTPFLLAYYGYLASTRSTSFHVLAAQSASGQAQIHPVAHLALLVGAGCITMIPLIMFASAARGISLGMIGFIQYLSPVVQLLIGVLLFHEHMELTRWIATGVVWVALAFLTTDMVITATRQKHLRRHAA